MSSGPKRCIRCGYSMTGLASRICPECGENQAFGFIEHGDRSRTWLILGALIGLLGGAIATPHQFHVLQIPMFMLWPLMVFGGLSGSSWNVALALYWIVPPTCVLCAIAVIVLRSRRHPCIAVYSCGIVANLCSLFLVSWDFNTSAFSVHPLFGPASAGMIVAQVLIGGAVLVRELTNPGT